MAAPDERVGNIPPEPATTPPVIGTPGPFETNWLTWFRYVRAKVNVLNQSLVNLAGLIGSGFLVKNGAAWLLRTLANGPGITIANPDGIADNPVISHADTSSVPNLSSDNSNGVVIQDVVITFDTFGHVQTAAVGTVDLDLRYTPTSSLSGTGFIVSNSGTFFFRTLTSGTGISISNGNGISANPIISHSSTSAITSPIASSNSAGTVIQNITATYDAFGHAQAFTFSSVNLDSRYIQSSAITGNGFVVNTGSGFVARSLTSGGAITITNNDGTAGNPTIAHTDTSSVANITSTNTNGVVIQSYSVTFDTYGHVQTTTLATVDLDSRYVQSSSLYYGQLYMQGNSTTTIITTINAFVKVTGTSTAGLLNSFTHSTGRLTYTGATTLNFRASAMLSLSSLSLLSTQTLSVRFAKNGSTIATSTMAARTAASGQVEFLGVQDIISLATNDYIEIFVANGTSADNITVVDMSLILVKL